MALLKYIVVQGIAYIIDLGLFWIGIKFLFLGPIFSSIIGKIASGTYCLFAHANFTFAKKEAHPQSKPVFRYFLVLILNIPFSSLILSCMLMVIQLPISAKVVSDALCTAINYLICKFFVFSPVRRNELYVTTQTVEK